jgi:AcrR family transcriptional regulator
MMVWLSDQEGWCVTVQVRAAGTRQLLINTAARLIDTNGMASTGINELLSVAGVSKGALYFHFSSKAALFEAVCDEAASQVRGLTDNLLGNGGEVWLGDLATFADVVSQQLRVSVVLRAALLIELHWAAAPSGSRQTPVRCALLSLISQSVTSNGAKGLRSDVDPKDVVDLLRVVMMGIETLEHHYRDSWSSERSAAVWRLLVTALSGGQEDSPRR